MTSVQLPRETKEYVPVLVAVNGVPVLSGVQFAITAANVRPTTPDWVAALVDSDKTLVLVEGLSVGRYLVWARVTAGQEVSVIEAGELLIT